MPTQLPVIALPNAILFPHMVLPIQIFEEHYEQLVTDAAGFGNKIAVTLHRKGSETEPQPNITCCVASVASAEETEEGGTSCVLTGLHRAVITDYTALEPYIVSNVEPSKDTTPHPEILRQQHEILSKYIVRYIFSTNLADELIHLASAISEAGQLSDFFAFYLVKDLFVKQNFLDTTDVNKRCEMATAILQEELKNLKK